MSETETPAPIPHETLSAKPLNTQVMSHLEDLYVRQQPEEICRFISNNLKAADQINEEWYRFIVREEMRGIGLLYLHEDIGGLANPVTDMMIAVIAGNRSSPHNKREDHITYNHLQPIASAGTPLPNIFGINSDDPSTRSSFRPFQIIPGQGQEYTRTIPGPENYPTATLRLFATLDWMANYAGSYFGDAISEYNHMLNHSDFDIKIDVTLLEIMNRNQLISSPQHRYDHILNYLRLKLEPSRETLAQQYPYDILKNHSEFWNSPDVESQPGHPFSLPETLSFISTCRKRNQLLSQLESAHSPKNLVLHSRPGLSSSALPDTDHLRQQIRLLENQSLNQFTSQWKHLLAEQVPQVDISATTRQLIAETAVREFLKYYQPHPFFPPKARLNENSFYQSRIQYAAGRLMANPLAQWCFSLGDYHFRESLMESIDQNPQSFYLLGKILTEQIIEDVYSFRNNDRKFLFQPDNNSEQSHPDNLASLVSSFRDVSGSSDFLSHLPDIVAEQSSHLTDQLPTPHRFTTLEKIKSAVSRLTDRGKYPIVKVAGAEFPAQAVRPRELTRLGIYSTAYIGFVLGLGSFIGYELSSMKPAIPDNKMVRLLTNGLPLPESGLRPGLKKVSEVVYSPPPPPDNPDQKVFFPIGSGSGTASQLLTGIYQEHLNPQQIPHTPDQLVLFYPNPLRNSHEISIPEGWKIDHLYVSEPDNEIYLQQHGQIFLGSSTEQSVLVLSPDTWENVQIMPVKGQPYHLSPQFKETRKILRFIADDPGLQERYFQLLDFVEQDPDPQKQSAALLGFIRSFNKYVNSTRFYSLTTSVVEPLPAWFASNPNSGFNCSIAAYLTQDLLEPVGVRTNRIVIQPAKQVAGSYWGDWRHEQLLVTLPDGTSVMIDNTPPVVEGKTPPETEKIVAIANPSFLDTHKEDFLQLAETVGIDILILASIYASLKSLNPSLKDSRLFSRLKQQVSPVLTHPEIPDIELQPFPPLSPADAEVVSALTLHLSRLRYSPNLLKAVDENLTDLRELHHQSGRHPVEAVISLTNDDKLSSVFMDNNIASAFDTFSHLAGSRIPHPDLPDSLSESLRQRTGQIAVAHEQEQTPAPPSIPDQFTALYRLGRLVQDARSESTRQQVINQITNEPPLSSTPNQLQLLLPELRHQYDQLPAHLKPRMGKYLIALHHLIKTAISD
jgi:hypothetical protein